jgi:hypothetical protein
MKSAIIKALALGAGFLCATGAALSQGWSDGYCWPNDGTPPPPAYSPDYSGHVIGNQLMLVYLGVSGTLTWGDGDDGPCFPGGITVNTRGRIGFMGGVEGSVQSSFDDLLAFVTGALVDVAGSFSYATTTRDGTRTLFGINPYTITYVGESDRYCVGETINDGVRANLRIDVVGDAARMQWTLTNEDNAASHGIGLWYGAWTGMVGNQPDATGAFFSGAQNIIGGKPGYVYQENGERPLRTGYRYTRTIEPARFPQAVNFMFGQTDAYGLRVENGATEATKDNFGQSDATEASEIAIGSWSLLLGAPGDNTFPDVILPDVAILGSPAFIQKYGEQTVLPGQSRTIVHYFRSTWGEANYSRPYAVVLDAPRLLSPDSNGTNGLSPNPFTIRVYIDNNRGYSGVNEEINLNQVHITLILPPGLSMSGGDTNVKTIDVVPAKQMRFRDFQVEADGEVFGKLNYTVKVEPTPGPTKFVAGTMQVSTTPRLNLVLGANLVTTPFIFQDSSWETVLQLVRPTQFQAYDWSPQQLGYVVSSSAARGKGTWIVLNDPNEQGSRPLGGLPQVPDDIATGAPLIQLKGGWNLIGNPYPYAFPIGQIVGVTGANNQQSYSWESLVNQGIISGSLAWWDPDTQSYKYIQGLTEYIQPNRGYWVYVYTVQDFTLSFPPVFEPFLPGSQRSGSGWQQSEQQWRLQLTARNDSSIDDQNFVGKAMNAQSATENRIMDAPLSPVQKVNLSIEQTINGQPARLAQSLLDGNGRKEWTVKVESLEAGSVTLTWPNVASVPRNTRFRLIDTANNLTRDLRQASGYTFTMNEPGTREFKVIAEPGTAGAAVIGNVTVAGGGREVGNTFTISYTLSGAATTQVRVLSAAGREVYASRGRADKQGENQFVWTTRDSAGRSVTPGVYRVEILAETQDGQRVRKVVPINVIR